MGGIQIKINFNLVHNIPSVRLLIETVDDFAVNPGGGPTVPPGGLKVLAGGGPMVLVGGGPMVQPGT